MTSSVRNASVIGASITEAMQNQVMHRKLAMPPILEAVQNHVTSKRHSEGGGEGTIHRLNKKKKMDFAFELS